MTMLKFPSTELDSVNFKIRIQSIRSLIKLAKIGIGNSKQSEESRIKLLSTQVKDEIDQYEFCTEKEIFDLEYGNCFEGNFECSQIENTATYSIIPTCYMIFETNLTSFAHIARKHFFLELKHNDLMGGKTEKVRKYLLKLANIDISKIKSWSTLKDLEIIRNCIVHNDGKIDSKFKDLAKIKTLTNKYKKYCSINKSLYEEDEYLIIRFSFCEFFVKKIEVFFNDLIALFGLNQNFYHGAEASQQILNERMKAKVEFDNSVKKAKEIYDNRMKLLQKNG